MTNEAAYQLASFGVGLAIGGAGIALCYALRFGAFGGFLTAWTLSPIVHGIVSAMKGVFL